MDVLTLNKTRPIPAICQSQSPHPQRGKILTSGATLT